MKERPSAVVIAAGGLGTRVAGWSTLLPKELRPVQGRPGLFHVLEEAAESGADRAVVVHHPYYAPLIDWVRQVLAPGALARYRALTHQPAGQCPPTERMRVDFVAQHGRYADITSALNGSEHLNTGDICLAFADNVDPTHTALSELMATASPGTPAVLAGPFDLRAAGSHGVIVCAGTEPELTMAELVEKPDAARAADLAAEHGADRLRLLQGRARLTPGLLHHLTAVARRAATEPKLSLALAAYARHHSVAVVTHTRTMIDLGAPDTAKMALTG
ncbi:sugar phosphate nucleotidyltransferase [Streptomyces sp. NBC_01012]|uniref:sugar phosphate nucleotidyltransferase n=1 Tax=Streptomyces sp. NBC_01012 TaxID=2903717 RepID=UPI002F906765|nr:sugar phosphate nucleotidyltransferase [Streptomyces sp. NBC_01012]